jgi:hypothetical protein
MRSCSTVRREYGQRGRDDGQYKFRLSIYADVCSRIISCLQSRPFGVALLIAGIDEKGPQLCGLSGLFICKLLTTGTKVPHRSFGNIYSLRGEGSWEWLRSSAERFARQVSQGEPHAPLSTPQAGRTSSPLDPEPHVPVGVLRAGRPPCSRECFIVDSTFDMSV